jgi:hypothetical protein
MRNFLLHIQQTGQAEPLVIVIEGKDVWDVHNLFLDLLNNEGNVIVFDKGTVIHSLIKTHIQAWHVHHQTEGVH